jgi:2-iminobutanoate/2-iminopropanoate deaminase
MEIRYINTPNAPVPAGHYSQATIHGDLIFVAGQLPIYAQTGEKELGSIEHQTEQVFRNIEAILKAAGSDLKKILKVNIYIADISLWDRVNSVYSSIFGGHRPARVVIPTKDLHYGFLIEGDAVATIDADQAFSGDS